MILNDCIIPSTWKLLGTVRDLIATEGREDIQP
jgi:hypothetical protein